MDRYAVIGHPITHSLSPKIHTLFAEQTNQKLQYEGLELPVTSFETRVWQLFKDGYSGFNITVPFKTDAFDFVDEMTERAKRARAVNTLKKMENGKIFGDTTDGVGLLSDLTENLKWTLKDKHILILGAGGAVRGVLEPLIAEDPKSILIANRTLKKAEELSDEFPEIMPCTFDEIQSGQIDIVINGTSASLSGQIPPIPEELINASTKCYDMMYGKEPTSFLKWAMQQGVTDCADGLGMLVGQAAESFEIWRGVRPQTQSVIDALRASLAD